LGDQRLNRIAFEALADYVGWKEDDRKEGSLKERGTTRHKEMTQ
jgi:hypothetical protein